MRTTKQPAPPQHPRRHGSRWPVACALLLLCASVGSTSASVQPAAPVPAAASTTAGDWWRGFGDATLERLISANAGQAAAVTQAWIGAQVFHAQAAITAELVRTARHEQTLLMNAQGTGGERERLLADLAQRLELVETASADRLSRRDAQLAQLARLCGLSSDALADVVRERLATLALPRFGAPLPRVDGDTPAALQSLFDNDRRASQAAELATSRQQAYRALRARHEAGEDSEIAVLESYQQLMLQGQLVAATSGDLALAWLRLLHGGALQQTAWRP